MADQYGREGREREQDPMRYRDQEGRRPQYERYGGQEYYEGSRGGRWDDESAWREMESPGGRYGQGRSWSRYGQQGWQREQEPGQYTRPGEWSRRLGSGEWQRQQQWELQGGPSSGRYPEENRGAYREQGAARGGAYGMEYPESSYRSPGGYGEMYWGGMEQSGPYSGRGPKGYKRGDDRIKEDVCERLTRHPEIDAEDIDVEVRNGEVMLKGSVMDRYQKRMAEDAIDGVSGVRDISNQLRVGMGAERGMQGQLATAGGSQYRSGSSSTSGGASSRAASSRSRPGTTSGTRTQSRTTGRTSTPSSRSSSTAGRSSATGRSTSPSGRTGTGSSRSTSASRPSGMSSSGMSGTRDGGTMSPQSSSPSSSPSSSGMSGNSPSSSPSSS